MTDDAFNLTDAGNALRFVDQHRHDVKFVRAWGWMCWDGRRWRRDEKGTVMERAKQTALSIYEEALTAPAERRGAVAKWAVQSESATRLREMVTLAQTDPAIAAGPEDFDRDPWLLNTESGVLDLRAARVPEREMVIRTDGGGVNLKLGPEQPHQRDLAFTRIAGTACDSSAKAPRFEAFIERILPDPQVRNYVRRAIGYSLTGVTSEQCLFMPYGPGGNGKSVLLNTVAAVLGDYAMTADANSFMTRRGDGPRNDLARLAGARFVASIEVEDGRRMAESLVKSITGGEAVTARFLFREHFEFTPSFKLWMAVNHRPVIRETGHAMWRRIHLIPFGVTIPPEERDPHLAEKLLEELPGILAWAVRGCVEWQKTGLRPPPAVLAATKDYRAESDTLGAFLEDECELGAGLTVAAGELYHAFKAWADREGEDVISNTAFGRKLTDAGFGVVKSGTKKRVGLCLRNGNGRLDSSGHYIHKVSRARDIGRDSEKLSATVQRSIIGEDAA